MFAGDLEVFSLAFWLFIFSYFNRYLAAEIWTIFCSDCRNDGFFLR